MAIYYKDEIPLFMEDTIKEYLDAARKCIETEKGNVEGSCYGMPAIALISCVMDAIGTFWNGDFSEKRIEKLKTENGRNHFETFYKELLKDKNEIDEETFISIFYYKVRCLLVHNGFIGKEIFFYPTEGESGRWFENEKKNGGTTGQKIFIKSLINVMDASFELFKKKISQSSTKTNDAPKTGMTSNDIYVKG